MSNTQSLAPARLRILAALDKAELKKLPYCELAAAAGIKHRAVGAIVSRLEDAGMVARDYRNIALTFCGMQALKAQAS